jgi:hypothetical protein
MNLRFVCFCCALVLLTACSKDDAEDAVFATGEQDERTINGQEEDGLVPVRFYSTGFTAKAITRTTGTAFEDNDRIGIFALNNNSVTTGELSPSGNYADNVEYVYNGSEFIAAGNNAIYQYTGEKTKTSVQHLIYYAVSPYTEGLNPVGGTFSVQEDQSTLDKYNASDLAVATDTTDIDNPMNIGLDFTRKMSRVEITLKRGGTYIGSLFRSDIRVTFLKVRNKVNINLNEAEPLVGVPADVADVVCFPMTGNDNYSRNKRVFQAIMAPQLLDAKTGEYIVRVDIGTEEPRYCSLSQSVQLESGCQYKFQYTVEKISVPGGGELVDPVID